MSRARAWVLEGVEWPQVVELVWNLPENILYMVGLHGLGTDFKKTQGEPDPSHKRRFFKIDEIVF